MPEFNGCPSCALKGRTDHSYTCTYGCVLFQAASWGGEGGGRACLLEGGGGEGGFFGAGGKRRKKGGLLPRRVGTVEARKLSHSFINRACQPSFKVNCSGQLELVSTVTTVEEVPGPRSWYFSYCSTVLGGNWGTPYRSVFSLAI